MFKKLVWTMVKTAAKKGAVQAVANQVRTNAQVRENLKALAALATQAAKNMQEMQNALKGGTK